MSRVKFNKLIKDTSILSTGTLISRILGFLRTILVAIFFGRSALLEAFIVAFRLPNIFRSMFAEGFCDSVATPVLSEYRDDKDKLFEVGSHLISIASVVLLLFTFLGVFFSKYLVVVIAPGFIAQPEKFAMTVSFTRITFFYLFFIGLSVNASALLYALRKFFVPAINPAFLNISFIIGIIFFAQLFENYILVACVFAAGIIQMIVPFIALNKQGFRLKFNLPAAFKNKAVIRMFKLFPPRILSSVVYHISVFIDTIFASFTHIVGFGAVATLHYANRLIQFPFALIALSVSRVAVVDLSYCYKKGNMDDFKKIIVFSFQNLILFIIPISLIFIFLSHELIDVLFRHGAFDLDSVIHTAPVLAVYSLGLFFFCGIKLLVGVFYSIKDTRTPAKTSAISLIINVVLSAILMFPLKIAGVALGSSIAAAVNFFLLYHILIKRIGVIDWQETAQQFIKVTIVGLVVALSLSAIWQTLTFNRYLRLLVALILGPGLFVLGGKLLRIKQINYLWRRAFSPQKSDEEQSKE